jgi:hypothetical protein
VPVHQFLNVPIDAVACPLFGRRRATGGVRTSLRLAASHCRLGLGQLRPDRVDSPP